MALFKCKMCGGSLDIAAGTTVIECEYCGTQQTLPKLDDDKRANMYDRANHFRRNNEFDKAMGIYEQILNEDNTDAEAYWSLVLCRYGIEYVEDPSTKRRIPTVNRAQYTSILADEDYKSALANADTYQKSIYELEAKAIDEIQKGILAISQKEEPFDVFICYKETDNSGRRTPDSVLAQELYFALKNEGFKVFFARITLEDKLGSAYEPYIFAALNSSKVMVVLGTKPEFFNAVWVKNEWCRYLALIKQGQKKMLIPAYKDMDPYDLPEEFSHLQAQDMSKLGFMQDLIRGIKKIVKADEPKQTVVKETVVKETVAATGVSNTTPLLKRAFMFLEDGDWDNANEYCEKVLDIDPENAQAYLGKLMAECHVRKQEKLKDCAEPFDNSNNYQKAVRFGDSNLKNVLQEYIKYIKERNEADRIERIYQNACNLMAQGKINLYLKAAELFESLKGYKDSAALINVCKQKAEDTRKDLILEEATAMIREDTKEMLLAAIEKLSTIERWKNASKLIQSSRRRIEELDINAENERKERIYIKASQLLARNYPTDDENISACKQAIEMFSAIPDWKDSTNQIAECNQKIEKCQAHAEVVRAEKEARKKRNKIIAIITTPIVCAIIVFIIVLNAVIIPNGKYNDAIALMNDGKYIEAISAFEALDGYKDSEAKIKKCNTIILDGKYNDAITLMNAGKYTEAISAFKALNGYKDSSAKIAECNTAYNNTILDKKYNDAIALMEAGSYQTAISAFQALNGYKDSATKITECNVAILDGKYNDAVALMKQEKYEEAYKSFIAIEDYKDSKKMVQTIQSKCQTQALSLLAKGRYNEAAALATNVNLNNATDYSAVAHGSYSLLCTKFKFTKIDLPAGVTSIDSKEFLNCRSLTSITIPSSVTSIGESAFEGCTSLTSITIPSSVKSIGFSAFKDCSSLTSMTIPFVGETVNSVWNNLFGYIFGGSSVSDNRNSVPTSLKAVVITGGTMIGTHAFDGCTSLTSITIPSSVTEIGSSAFEDCSSLTSITIPSHVTKFAAFAFSGCSSLKNVTISSGVTEIGASAFEGCTSLTNITIPSSVTAIGDDAFNGCSSLKNVTISSGVTEIGSSAFEGCSSLTSITVPSSVTEIGFSAFKGCSSLTSMTIPFVGQKKGEKNNTYFEDIFGKSYIDSVTNIPNSLKTVVITDATIIGSYSFDDCSSLTSVTIPSSITEIGMFAFCDCNNLTNITFKGTVAQWNSITFANTWNIRLAATEVICSDGTVALS